MKIASVRNYELIGRIPTSTTCSRVFGELWRGRHATERGDRWVIIRILRFADGVEIERTITEAMRTGGQVPGVLLPFAIAESGREGWLIYPVVAGTSLLEWRLRETLDDATLAAILRVIFQLMGSLHANGKIHGHLRCSNILLTSNGELTILDFGLVHLEPYLSKNNGSVISNSPYYLSPEAVNSGGILNVANKVQADIWNLGILAYELATKSTPTEQYTAQRSAQLIAELKSIPAGILRSHGNEFRDFVSQCLQRDPLSRVTCQQALRDLPFLTNAVSGQARLAMLLSSNLKPNQSSQRDSISPRVVRGLTANPSAAVRYNVPKLVLSNMNRLDETYSSRPSSARCEMGDHSREWFGLSSYRERERERRRKMELSATNKDEIPSRDRSHSDGLNSLNRSRPIWMERIISEGSSRQTTATTTSTRPLSYRGGGDSSSAGPSPRDAARPPRSPQPDDQPFSTTPRTDYIPRSGSLHSHTHSKSSSPLDFVKVDSLEEGDSLMLRTVLSPALNGVLDDVSAGTARNLFEVVTDLQEVVASVDNKMGDATSQFVREVVSYVESSQVAAVRSLATLPPTIALPDESALTVEGMRGYLAHKFISKYVPFSNQADD
eukprot:TRINITY_DN9392_c0_g1_i1.p1 TRINITY_DN9392_c0_g1~~TRINITY_DN9392_c0_g1_i1.p1  ORF type:complete len:610 (+),score=80.07 TRINITY_DN9392_c0_g1_i1:147-1976(+)